MRPFLTSPVERIGPPEPPTDWIFAAFAVAVLVGVLAHVFN